MTLELEKSGQKITIDLEEARQLVKGLAKFVQENDKAASPASREERRRKNPQKNYQLLKSEIPSMSEAKKNEILKHVSKKVSARPRTLSNLLKGVSYVPNNLPLIRAAIEAQGNVAKRTIGKRIYYQRKAK